MVGRDGPVEVERWTQLELDEQMWRWLHYKGRSGLGVRYIRWVGVVLTSRREKPALSGCT